MRRPLLKPPAFYRRADKLRPVIYYFYDEHMPIYALLIYAKNERADLTSNERRAVAAFAAGIKATRKRK